MGQQLDELITDLYKNINNQIECDNKLLDFRKGSLVLKYRRQEAYYYLTYRDGDKVKTDYLGKLSKTNLNKIKKELDDGTKLRNYLKRLQQSEKDLRKLIKAIDSNALKKEVYEIIDIIVIIRPILKAFKLGKVYLYGSYAKGDQDELSDINIYCDKPEKPIKDLIKKIEKETGKKVNIVTTTSRIPDSILNEINNQKILIYRGN